MRKLLSPENEPHLMVLNKCDFFIAICGIDNKTRRYFVLPVSLLPSPSKPGVYRIYIPVDRHRRRHKKKSSNYLKYEDAWHLLQEEKGAPDSS